MVLGEDKPAIQPLVILSHQLPFHLAPLSPISVSSQDQMILKFSMDINVMMLLRSEKSKFKKSYENPS